jgi:hypothetical protein
MTPETLLELLLIAANAKTAEERARLAWRMNDLMWHRAIRGNVELGVAREFNDEVQDMNEKEDWPWIDGLFTQEERSAMHPPLPEEAKDE